MATTLPVPITFALPDGWQAVAPDDVGALSAASVARYRESDAGFTPNITISQSYRPDDEALSAIADRAVAGLQSEFTDVELVSREFAGTDEAPAVVQMLRLVAELGNGRRMLGQSQVHLTMRDSTDPTRRVILHLTLTSSAEQLDSVIGDFQSFVSTVRPETGPG